VKTRIPIRPFATLAFDGFRITAGVESLATPEGTRERTILLVSHDAALGDGLCLVAAQNALSVMQTPSLHVAMEQVNRVQPTGILLDLDLPSDAGWEAAEWFLGHEVSVPILMLTGRADHHELEPAIRCGTVFDKSNGPARSLDAAVSMLEQSMQQAKGRIAPQQAWLRRAKPYRWGAAAAPGYRGWGLNE